MFEYILKIRTPITYRRANEVLERVNELIGALILDYLCRKRYIRIKNLLPRKSLGKLKNTSLLLGTTGKKI